MSNYRRLISYIYSYEGEIKGKNIGFAKLEARNGQCKISVNVKRIYVGSSDIGVYLLTGQDEIKLGNIFVRNGNGEFRTVVNVANVENTGVNLDLCHGLTIHEVENAWQCYTTIWEDAVAHAAEVELAEVTSERVRQERQDEPEERVSIADQIENELELEQELEKALEEEQEEEPEEQSEEQTVHMEEAEQEQAPELPPLSDPEILNALDHMETEEGDNRKIWNFFKTQHAKIPAFEYPHGCEVLTIKPQDIGLLPREVWVFGNNSFLLHGYYNYRYLILARLGNPQGKPRFLLGVPGHYYSNEKYMASMFGFPEFVLSKKQPTEDGRFGYWYTDIKVED